MLLYYVMLYIILYYVTVYHFIKLISYFTQNSNVGRPSDPQNKSLQSFSHICNSTAFQTNISNHVIDYTVSMPNNRLFIVNDIDVTVNDSRDRRTALACWVGRTTTGWVYMRTSCCRVNVEQRNKAMRVRDCNKDRKLF